MKYSTATALILFFMLIGFCIGKNIGKQEKHEFLQDTAGQFSDVIRLHKDSGCKTLQSDIDCILDNDSILDDYVYCY